MTLPFVLWDVKYPERVSHVVSLVFIFAQTLQCETGYNFNNSFNNHHMYLSFTTNMNEVKRWLTEDTRNGNFILRTHERVTLYSGHTKR